VSKGADIALLVHEGVVVDGDRCTPIILDSDGVAYAPSVECGGIDSITLRILQPAIESAGIPFRYARLTEKLLGRASELIVVGTGVGVAWLNEVDSQNIGSNSPGPLYETCSAAFEAALADAWSPLDVI
jgi:branched-subunit amino acid aminotransferase/4-amino-4-deoxychorismate lyase